MVQRLQQFYHNKIVPQLTEQFKYTNKHQVPILEKIVINQKPLHIEYNLTEKGKSLIVVFKQLESIV